MSAVCDYGSEIESTQHILLRCPFFNDERKKLFKTKSLHDLKPSIPEFQKDFVANKLFFGSDNFEETINKIIVQSTITLNRPQLF